RAVGDVDLANAGDLRGPSGNAVDTLAGHQQMDFAKLRGGGDCGQRRILDRRTIMFDQNQGLHFATPSAFNLPTSSSTEATFSPAWRLGGSTTFNVSSRRPMSTPSSSAVRVTSGFDLAFMMLGSEA